MDKALEIKAALQILKPRHKVFEAIADPAKMSNYFISKSSGRMEEGTTLMWSFPEFEGEFPVRVGIVRPGEYLSFTWDGEDGTALLVEVTLSTYGNDHTVVTVTEKGMPNNEAGLAWLKGNTEGWANFLACLKAYVEYGINLRKGAFDFRFVK